MKQLSSTKVAILHPTKGYNWERQMPRGGFDGVVFDVNRLDASADWMFVYEGIDHAVSTFVPKCRRVFVCGEPASVKSYPKGFLAQFGIIWTTDPRLVHSGATQHHPCSPWHVGAFANPLRKELAVINVEEFLQNFPAKTKLISVVSSNKAFTEGHRKRLAFVQALKHEFGQSIDVFGRGLNDFTDKWDVLADYKYHVSIENSAYADYWTEKLANPILTLTYPIYFGCPNIRDYFDHKALEPINIEHIKEAISKIRTLIKDETYEKSISELICARELIIYKYNFLGEIARYVRVANISPLQSPIGPEKILPENAFSRLPRLAKRARRLLFSGPSS